MTDSLVIADAPARSSLAVREDRRTAHSLYTSSLAREHGWEPLRVEGQLPEGLRGTMFRNGPGLWDRFGHPYGHAFEGDGAVVAMKLGGDGSARGAHRVIESAGLLAERRAGHPLYGDAASWPRRVWNGLTQKFKNTANTSVMSWQGRLFALLEAARPTELDPATLATIGASDLGISEMTAFSAHPHTIPGRNGTTYGFGQRIGAKNAVDVFELPKTGAARRLASVPLPRAVMLHDAAVTERHIVFLVGPAEIAIGRALLGIGDFRSMWKWRPEHGTEVIVVPLDRPTEVVRFAVDAFWVWHVANAFERGSEIVIDLVRYPDFSTSMDDLGTSGAPLQKGRPTRMVIDVAGRKIASSDPIADVSGEFPVIDGRLAGRAHSAIFLASDEASGAALVRLDADTGVARSFALEPGERPSELLYVPADAHAPEGEGWALSLIWSAAHGTSHVAVFDAQHIEDGPLARAHFDHHVPLTFHGTFVPA